MALRICFRNFWPGAFDGANSAIFLPYAFDEACGPIERVDEVSRAEVVVSSVFGTEPAPPEKTILFVGENVRPNLAMCRFALSFDYDPYAGRNFRLPLWWWRLAWPGYAEYWRTRPSPLPGSTHGYEDLLPIDALTRARVPAGAATRFCALIASNPEPLRINLYLALQSIGAVEGMGPMFGKPLFASKFAVLPSFRFCLCPENGIYPGYHTEKLVDAWYGGCVPLYSGDRLLANDFNARAVVNYQDDLDLGRFIERVRRLEGDTDAYAAIHREPLLLRKPTLEPLFAFLRAAVDEIRREVPA